VSPGDFTVGASIPPASSAARTCVLATRSGWSSSRHDLHRSFC